MGAEDAFDSNMQLTDGAGPRPDGKRYYRKSQLIAWVLLVVVMTTVVGLLCGLLPQCVEIPPEELPSEGPIKGTSPPPKEPTTTGNGKPSTTERMPTEEPPVSPTPGPCQGEWCELRLPESLQADHYILRLRPDLAAETYDGDVTIQITVTENIKYPRIHFKELTITNSIVRRKDGTALPIADTFIYQPNEFYVIEMEDELTPGEYEIELHFTNSLVGKIVGFYKSIYTNAAGEERWLATSKFQPTDARRAFPCLDEPDFKANFTTTLEHNMDASVYNALSNMPVKTVTTDGDWTSTLFETSVKMSTYLAIFIVCDFKYTEGFISGDRPFRVYAPPDKVDQTAYALQVGLNITTFYEEYFDLPYPLPKLDMIAIPDFVSGAMEHWGLITYRERYLLYDPLESSEGNKQRINVIVAHELAHMWFGNIVTMKWWDDLWLNEGFASYLEYLGAAEAEPTWNMLDQFVTGEIYYVFELDQIVSSHPIVVEVNNPDEINQIFDAISYSKGASVIRMMNYIIGEEAFREGLTIFLKRFQFDNAVSQDLWDALQEASGIDVGEIMDTWTLQMGFPVVNLTRDGSKVQANQEWFLVDPMANKTADEYGSPYGYNWDIFFDYYFQSDTTPTQSRMKLSSTSFDWPPGAPTTDWYIANVGQTGYYRVNYDTQTWDSLVDQLLSDHTVFSAADRSGLIDDAFNLARAEDIDYTVALNLTKYLINERDYVPWDAAFGNIFWMGEMLRFRPSYGLFRRYIEAQSKPRFDELGWNDITEHLAIFLQSDIIDMSCGHGSADCLDQGVELFRTFTSGTSLKPDFRSNAYQYGMQEEGNQDNWDYLWEQYTTTQSASEKSRLLYALARTREVWLISRYIEYTEDESKIREQDYFSVMGYIADNPVGNPLVWDYVRENWQALVDRFGLSNRYLGRLVPGITEYYSTELKQQEMLNFFAEYPDAGAGETARKQALERVQTNINWLARNEETIEAWLEENTRHLM
ncbi:glutamyl aminopeptidase-like [Amphiura filiformis]|uniref:glutamyl aminopeptidase-like n=1 Tax=Amphiura filiformis TaxID=82378 RepID=UPI003B21EAEA